MKQQGTPVAEAAAAVRADLLGQEATEKAADDIFAGIDVTQPLGALVVQEDDSNRFMLHVRDNLDPSDKLGHEGKTLRP